MLLAALQSSCSLPYYMQAANGQLKLVNGRKPIEHLLGDESLDPELRARLELTQQALEFAHAELLLPDNGSYTHYYDTGQPYIVWNVFAAPEFSLEPRTWCFPVTGCIAYRGYFREQSARDYGAKLAEQGDDVFVGGVTAYSTLGRFRDPVLNTMLTMDDAYFTGLLFHELTHQLLYVQDDSAFNEGFATAVEYEGLRRWQRARGIERDIAREADDRRQREQVLELMAAAREELEALYQSGLEADDMRTRKQAAFDRLPDDYRALLREWEAAGLKRRPYEGLFAQGLNNASLGAVATYEDYVPAFNVLLAECEASLECFYERAEELAELDLDERTARMQVLLERSAS